MKFMFFVSCERYIGFDDIFNFYKSRFGAIWTIYFSFFLLLMFVCACLLRSFAYPYSASTWHDSRFIRISVESYYLNALMLKNVTRENPLSKSYRYFLHIKKCTKVEKMSLTNFVVMQDHV